MLPGMSWGCAVLVVIAAHLSSCVAVPPEPARLGLKLAPATLGASLSLQQHLSIERQGHIDELDAALEVDEQKLDLVGLAFGQRVFTLRYDGHQLEVWRHPLLPAELRGEDVLEDLQMTLWPIDALRRALPLEWRIEENGRRRTVLMDDAPVLTIDYDSEPRWSGKIVLANLRYQYRLTIQSVSSGP